MFEEIKNRAGLTSELVLVDFLIITGLDRNKKDCYNELRN